MTIQEIIDAAKFYTQTAGSAWYADVDALRTANRAYRDVYERILDTNDEFFIKEVSVLASALTPVRDGLYEYTLPSDWHRLRSLRAVVQSGDVTLGRLDPQGLGRYEGYRYFNGKLRITFHAPYSEFRIEYYPTPVEFVALNTQVVYPPQLEPLILAYQMAMDITKAQKGDPTPHAEEYSRLWNRFEHAAERRDNFRYPRVANTYRSTFPGW